MKKKCFIDLKNVSLIYDLNYEGVNSIKERVINFIYKSNSLALKPKKLYALNNLTVSIDQGERIGVIGLNGSGKSTLLKVISGILKPQKGNVTVNGNIQPLIEIGAGFNPEFSGRENIFLNGAMLGFSPFQIKERELEIIEFSELESFIDLPVKYYSSGMAVRLAFTIATIIQPEILLMDEMLSAGDLSFIEKAKHRIDQILNKAKILVLVSHDLNLVENLCNRCLVMQNGEVAFDGSTYEALDFYRGKTLEKMDSNKSVKKNNEDVTENICFQFKEINVTPSVLNNGNITFVIKFDTNQKFDSLFCNLVINNKFGATKLHLRNDFSGLSFKDIEIGTYNIQIKLESLPLKSEKYYFHFRLVGISSDSSIIQDTEIVNFEILGSRKHDNLTPHEWIVSGPCIKINDM